MSVVATPARRSFSSPHGTTAAKVPAAEFLSFRLGDEEYGID